MKNIKKASINQAVWRANVRQKKGIKQAFHHLEKFQNDEIIELRLKGLPYREIAERYNISIGAVAKKCTAKIPKYLIDCRHGSGNQGNINNRPSEEHPWNKKL